MSAAPTPTGPRQGLRLGRYELLAKLAQGGMASVYVGRAVGVAGFSRLVAVKLLHPHLAHEAEFVEMFLDEARIAAAIRHPNVVATHDIAEADELGFYLVMDYVEGGHLGMLLRAAQRRGETSLPTPVLLRVFLDVLDGLGFAHGLEDADGQPLNVVHRDVSPQNVLVGSDGIARITDFGIARAESRLTSTRDGRLKGKISYVSPEQALGRSVDQRSDLFSLGVVLYEALSGKRLVDKDKSDLEILRSIVELEPPRISEQRPELAAFDEVLARALAVSRSERFSSASEMAAAIEDAAAEAQITLATKRQVGALVRELLGSRLEKLDSHVRLAMVDADPFELTPSGSRPVAEPSLTEQAPSVPAQAPARRRTPWVLFAGLLLAALVGGFAAVTWPAPDDATVEPPPMAAAPEPATQAPALEEPHELPVVEPEPAPTPVVEATTEPAAEPARRPRRARRPRPAPAPVAEPAAPAPAAAPALDPLADNPYRRAMQ